jgi:hypothetical protein
MICYPTHCLCKHCYTARSYPCPAPIKATKRSWIQVLPSSILYICCIFALLCPVLLLQVRACQAEDAHQELRQVVASSEAAVKQVRAWRGHMCKGPVCVRGKGLACRHLVRRTAEWMPGLQVSMCM